MNPGMATDGLPEAIRHSEVLSGNDLGQLANVSEIPALNPDFQYTPVHGAHADAKALLAEGKVEEAWQVLLQG